MPHPEVEALALLGLMYVSFPDSDPFCCDQQQTNPLVECTLAMRLRRVVPVLPFNHRDDTSLNGWGTEMGMQMQEMGLLKPEASADFWPANLEG